MRYEDSNPAIQEIVLSGCDSYECIYPPPPFIVILLCYWSSLVTLCRSEDVDLEKDFEKNELNSVVYLISMAMQISNFAVNYKVGVANYILCTRFGR